MTKQEFETTLNRLYEKQEKHITKKNKICDHKNGIFNRYENPCVTPENVPIHWKYDLNFKTNPYLMERLGLNATLNCGAFKWKDKYCLMVRTEGVDRKSFFAVAESPNGIDNFRFWDYPVVMPETDRPDTNVYDMRITKHEDGWIYGVFCTERKDPNAPASNTFLAEAQGGIARTKDFVKWERLPDMKSPSAQQRNLVLHPEFVDGKYAFYTRPQDGFVDTGKGGGIGWGLSKSMNPAIIESEIIIEPNIYHTIKELKNGQGPTPIKTKEGWLHLAHGTRNTASGLRYVLYIFVTSLEDPSKVIYRPGGHLIAPEGDERIGDLQGLVFGNGWIEDDNGDVFIYYAACDTITYVAKTSVDKLLDYAKNTPEDGLRSAKCVEQRIELINNNLKILNG